MFERLKSRIGHLLAAASATMVSSVALAQTGPEIDTSSVTTFISGEIVGGIVAVGTAFLIVAAIFAGFRWVRGAAGGN